MGKWLYAGTDAFNQGAQDLNKVGNNFVGEIAELLVFDKELNTVTREKVEGYLAHKWGLEENLLPAHPYSTVPPAFGGNQEIIWGGLISYQEMNQTKYKLPDKALGDLLLNRWHFPPQVFRSALYQVIRVSPLYRKYIHSWHRHGNYKCNSNG